jgi:hypothetical protein
MAGELMNRLTLLLGLSVLTLSTQSLAAERKILANCSSSKGSAYFFEGGIVPPGQGGWMEDGITGGHLQLILDGDDLDIVFKDRSGGVRSHREEGSKVWPSSYDANSGTLIVIAENKGGGSVEHFLFRLNKYSVGTVAWGTLRNSPEGATKSSLMTAKCGPNE